MNTISQWHSHNPFTIRIVGTGQWVKSIVNQLEYLFNEPKFGYNGELYDEYDD